MVVNPTEEMGESLYDANLDRMALKKSHCGDLLKNKSLVNQIVTTLIKASNFNNSTNYG